MLEEDVGEKSCQQDVLGRLQVLMISTPKRSDLIFPKVRQQDQMAIRYAPFNQSCMQRIRTIAQLCIWCWIWALIRSGANEKFLFVICNIMCVGWYFAAAGWIGERREHRRSCLQGGLRGSRRQGHYQRGCLAWWPTLDVAMFPGLFISVYYYTISWWISRS